MLELPFSCKTCIPLVLWMLLKTGSEERRFLFAQKPLYFTEFLFLECSSKQYFKLSSRVVWCLLQILISYFVFSREIKKYEVWVGKCHEFFSCLLVWPASVISLRFFWFITGVVKVFRQLQSPKQVFLLCRLWNSYLECMLWLNQPIQENVYVFCVCIP